MKNIFVINKTLVITLVLIVTFLSNVTAQDDQSDFQFWFGFRTFYTIDEKWIYDGDYSLRGFKSKEDWRRVYIYPAFIFNASTYVDLRGGMPLFLQGKMMLPIHFKFAPSRA